MMTTQPAGKRAIFFLNFDNTASIFNGRLNFQAIANDPWIVKEPETMFLIISRYALKIEVMIGPAKPFPFFQNDQPRETGLIDFKDEAFKEEVIIS